MGIISRYRARVVVAVGMTRRQDRPRSPVGGAPRSTGSDRLQLIRVSTQRQGQSGLGLQAKRSAVGQFCKQHGLKMVREFREVESGRKNDRAVLREAIAYAKRAKATLLIAKLNKLARNVTFIANLMESGVEFRACDFPEANRLLLHIMAAVAEAEAKAISDRTRVALQAAKERGTRLGAANPRSRNLTPAAMRIGRRRGARPLPSVRVNSTQRRRHKCFDARPRPYSGRNS